jgi:hypothetical protein
MRGFDGVTFPALKAVHLSHWEPAEVETLATELDGVQSDVQVFSIRKGARKVAHDSKRF